MHRNRAINVVLICILLTSISSHAIAEDTKITPSATEFTADQRGNFGFILRESYVLTTENSALFAYRPPSTYVCTSIEDPHCNLSNITNWNAIVIAPPCHIDSSSVCIKSLQIRDSNGGVYPAEFERVINTDSSFIGSQKYNLPSGSSTSLWVASTVSGTKRYAVHLREQLSKGGYAEESFRPDAFELNVTQYESRPVSDARNIKTYEANYPDGRQGSMGIGAPQGINCVWQEKSMCGVEQLLDPSEEISVSFQLPTSLSGWLHGRLQEAKIQTQAISETYDLMTISGRPAEVPTVAAFVPYSQTNEAMKKFYANNSHAKIGDTVGYFISSVGDTALSYLDAFQEVIKDRATNKSGIWSVGSITSSVSTPKNRCISETKGFSGLVTSNAMVYSDAPPTFDGTSFNYKVSGLHFDSDGSVFQGSYSLSIASPVVRCIYGLSNSPIYASVSIVGESGEQKIFTTTFKEEKGWAVLTANGFTFSRPKISVRFSQVVNETSTTTETHSVETKIPTPIKKSTFCVRGKITKIPSTSSNKCPKGFKRIIK